MKGFTFSTLAKILLVLIGLIAVLTIVTIVILSFLEQSNSYSGGINEQIGNLQETLNDCESLGGKCYVGGCAGKTALTGEDLCETNEVCCI